MQTSIDPFSAQSNAPLPLRGSNFSYPPTPQDWAKIQDTVHHLYVIDKRPLKDVRLVLTRQHGFKAT